MGTEKIIIDIDGERFEGELDDTPTARSVMEALPIESRIKVWGDEFYFSAGINLGKDQTVTTDVDEGDLAYWPEGDALCIFFGPTPASDGEKPVPAGPVNKIGRINAKPDELKKLRDAGKVTIKPDELKKLRDAGKVTIFKE